MRGAKSTPLTFLAPAFDSAKSSLPVAHPASRMSNDAIPGLRLENECDRDALIVPTGVGETERSKGGDRQDSHAISLGRLRRQAVPKQVLCGLI